MSTKNLDVLNMVALGTDGEERLSSPVGFHDWTVARTSRQEVGSNTLNVGRICRHDTCERNRCTDFCPGERLVEKKRTCHCSSAEGFRQRKIQIRFTLKSLESTDFTTISKNYVGFLVDSSDSI